MVQRIQACGLQLCFLVLGGEEYEAAVRAGVDLRGLARSHRGENCFRPQLCHIRRDPSAGYRFSIIPVPGTVSHSVNQTTSLTYECLLLLHASFSTASFIHFLNGLVRVEAYYGLWRMLTTGGFDILCETCFQGRRGSTLYQHWVTVQQNWRDFAVDKDWCGSMVPWCQDSPLQQLSRWYTCRTAYIC